MVTVSTSSVCMFIIVMLGFNGLVLQVLFLLITTKGLQDL